ncbi:hypothetical protein AUC70_05945 [Methyloceanibacter stevinii]|uniref:TonB C-terminal domain-containing protein n=1 Tax=Methyloceanibacter stevinii TaxID=1774970 RepID=A0A1E3VQK3_9HYPH|nr:TonB family protein [Methyloceanibacter stevinii]ODR95236.1 hypothetical protein AUC70_05945 [Methyloceanibacter stevinii]
MKRLLEATVFVAIAVVLHLVVFGFYSEAPSDESAGDAGDVVVSVAAASSALSGMVAEWEKPPEPVVEEPPAAVPEPQDSSEQEVERRSKVPPAETEPAETSEPESPPAASEPAETAEPEPLPSEKADTNTEPEREAPNEVPSDTQERLEAPKTETAAPVPLPAPSKVSEPSVPDKTPSVPEQKRSAPEKKLSGPEPQPKQPPAKRPERKTQEHVDKQPKTRASRPEPTPAGSASRNEPSGAPSKRKSSSGQSTKESATGRGSQSQRAAGAKQESESAGRSKTRSRPATVSKSSARSLIASWGARIRARINARKRRPAGNAHGTTIVHLRVATSGRLLSASVARSSGNSALDRAAMSAVRGAGRFPAAPKGLTNSSYSFSQSIRF